MHWASCGKNYKILANSLQNKYNIERTTINFTLIKLKSGI